MAEIREVKKIDKKLFQNRLVSAKLCGNILETSHISRRNQKATIIKLDKHRYVVCDTGEIKNYKHIENRADNTQSVRRSLNRLKDYINTNITRPQNALWITLTYAENMTDTERLKKDFEKFIKRLRYAYGDCEYIVAFEPQGRGAWHAHLLLIYDKKPPYIPNAKLAEIWQQGFVKINLLKNIDNIGLYLTAYLGDMELKDLSEYNGEKLKEVKANGKSKRIIKGGRLKLYPAGFNLYRKSKGILPPVKELIEESELLEKVKGKTLKYEKVLEIQIEGSNAPLYIHYRTWVIKEPNQHDTKRNRRKTE